ncbi:Hypothetical predicted protein [Mytilus galloprovincialis]|uniref:Integrase zinc-binding domain-containing protein n=1 Tax=Mytilus galloprovincialis TaxID=29158 RepID=A0A8B6C1C4_MYTGA|nr:Hypothetical predicted protein [Mytilus galloprovincialis]
MTCLATDWSVDGIGFFLMQKYCQCSSKTPTCCNDGWKLCLVGSRFTHPAESRYAPIEEDNDTANDASTVAAATCALNAVITVVTWSMVREATASDPTFVNLIRQLEAGFPEDYKELPTDLRPYHRFASSLCTVDGVVLMGQRIVIPPALRKPVLNALHAAHQGVSAMRARAMDSVYWPQ